MKFRRLTDEERGKLSDSVKTYGITAFVKDLDARGPTRFQISRQTIYNILNGKSVVNPFLANAIYDFFQDDSLSFLREIAGNLAVNSDSQYTSPDQAYETLFNSTINKVRKTYNSAENDKKREIIWRLESICRTESN